VNHHKELTAGEQLTLPKRKGARQRNKPQVNKYSEKPPPKQGSWRTTELISRTRGQHALKLPHFTEGGTDQAPASERQKKKTLPTTQPPGETTTELLLK
jgi:hypothetical protein